MVHRPHLRRGSQCHHQAGVGVELLHLCGVVCGDPLLSSRGSLQVASIGPKPALCTGCGWSGSAKGESTGLKIAPITDGNRLHDTFEVNCYQLLSLELMNAWFASYTGAATRSRMLIDQVRTFEGP